MTQVEGDFVSFAVRIAKVSPTTLKISRPETKHSDDKKSDERHLLPSDSVNIGDDEVVPGDVLELGHLKYSSKASAAVSY